MNFSKYAVGDVIDAKNYQECAIFDMTDSGANLHIFLNKPTQKEIEAIKKGSIELNMFIKDNIIFIISKFANVLQFDSPYTIHLSKNLTNLQELNENEGYSCNIILLDTKTSKIQAIRHIGFSTSFSKKLKENIEKQQKLQFIENEFDSKLAIIFKNYTIQDMEKYSIINYRIK